MIYCEGRRDDVSSKQPPSSGWTRGCVGKQRTPHPPTRRLGIKIRRFCVFETFVVLAMVSLASWFVMGKEQNARHAVERRNERIKVKAVILDFEALPVQFQKWEAEKEWWESMRMAREDIKALSDREAEKGKMQANELIMLRWH